MPSAIRAGGHPNGNPQQNVMAKIKINLSIGEIIIEFTDTADLERQLKDLDFSQIESMLERKANGLAGIPRNASPADSKVVEELGTVNLLKVSEGGQDATKLAVFLSANKMNRDDVKKITGITILS